MYGATAISRHMRVSSFDSGECAGAPRGPCHISRLQNIMETLGLVFLIEGSVQRSCFIEAPDVYRNMVVSYFAQA